MLKIAFMFAFTFIQISPQANASYTYLHKRNENGSVQANFNEYEGTVFTPTTHTTIGNHNGDDYLDCIRQCDKLGKKCQSMNIFKNSNKFDCTSYTVTQGSFEKQANAIFITKKKRTCSGYCENLKYLNLCESCRCVDKCDSKIPYYCDCTADLKLKDDCSGVIKAGFNKSGVYQISLSSKLVKKKEKNVFCEIKEDGTVWTTMMRRLDVKTTFFAQSKEAYKNGFGMAHDDNYWLGLDHLIAMTEKSGTILKVEVMSKDSKIIDGIYHNFQVGKDTKLTYSTYESKTCLPDVLKGYLGEIFKVYGSGGHYWWSSGDSHQPTRKHFIYWGEREYGRITFLLQSNRNLKTTDDHRSKRISGEQLLTGPPVLGREFCIIFQFKLTTKENYSRDVIRFKHGENYMQLPGIRVDKNGSYSCPQPKQFSSQTPTDWIDVKMTQYKSGNHYIYEGWINNETICWQKVNEAKYSVDLKVQIKDCDIRRFYVDGRDYMKEWTDTGSN